MHSRGNDDSMYVAYQSFALLVPDPVDLESFYSQGSDANTSPYVSTDQHAGAEQTDFSLCVPDAKRVFRAAGSMQNCSSQDRSI